MSTPILPLTDLSRLSLNQYTTNRWTLGEVVDGCARAGIPYIGVWRDKVHELGVTASAQVIRDAGLKVSSVCRGGFFPALTAAERRARIEDNHRAIDMAAELGAPVLVLVCGPAPDHDLVVARQMVQDGIEQIIPYAVERGVQLGIEPLHPIFAGDRSVIVTLGHALTLAEHFATPVVGVIIDAYHVWWDPDLYALIERAAPYTLGFHVDDWLTPLPDHLLGRGMMGDGVIQLRRMRGAVDAAGYSGPIEVEIFNRTVWDTPGDDVLALVCERYLAYV